MCRGKQFQEDLVLADLDVEGVFRSRLRDPRPRKENPAILRETGIPEAVSVSGYRPIEKPPLPPADGAQPLDSVGEVYQALVVGTGDYVRKSGFQKVLIGLSGGIDSALVACVVVQMTTTVDLTAFVGWLIATFFVLLIIETVALVRAESKTNLRKNNPSA